MRAMMQEGKKMQIASSWEEIPFGPLVRLTFMPSLVFALVVSGFVVWQGLAENSFSQTTVLIIQYVLAVLLSIGLITFYKQRAQLSFKQLLVVVSYSGLFAGLIIAIVKLVIAFHVLELFRLISEPTLMAILMVIVTAVTSNRNRLSKS